MHHRPASFCVDTSLKRGQEFLTTLPCRRRRLLKSMCVGGGLGGEACTSHSTCVAVKGKPEVKGKLHVCLVGDKVSLLFAHAQAGWTASSWGFSCLYFPSQHRSAEITGIKLLHWLSLGVGDLNSGPHTLHDKGHPMNHAPSPDHYVITVDVYKSLWRHLHRTQTSQICCPDLNADL